MKSAGRYTIKMNLLLGIVVIYLLGCFVDGIICGIIDTDENFKFLAVFFWPILMPVIAFISIFEITVLTGKAGFELGETIRRKLSNVGKKRRI